MRSDLGRPVPTRRQRQSSSRRIHTGSVSVVAVQIAGLLDLETFLAGEIGAVTLNVLKSLWASVQGDPAFMRRVNGWLTIFWIGMIPVSFVMHWLSSVV